MSVLSGSLLRNWNGCIVGVRLAARSCVSTAGTCASLCRAKSLISRIYCLPEGVLRARGTRSMCQGARGIAPCVRHLATPGTSARCYGVTGCRLCKCMSAFGAHVRSCLLMCVVTVAAIRPPNSCLLVVPTQDAMLCPIHRHTNGTFQRPSGFTVVSFLTAVLVGQLCKPDMQLLHADYSARRSGATRENARRSGGYSSSGGGGGGYSAPSGLSLIHI